MEEKNNKEQNSFKNIINEIKKFVDFFSGKIEINITGIMEGSRRNKKKVSESSKNELLTSLRCMIVFYAITLLLWEIISDHSIFNKFLGLGFFIILTNFGIAFVTQVLHYFSTNTKDHMFDSIFDCSLRCSAGISEMVFYILMFTFKRNAGLPLIAGYLVMKTLSIWRSEDPRREGLSTAVLRIAVIMSILISYLGYYSFLK